MNLNEYKASKIKEIKFFLRGLHPENIGIKDKKIITGLTPLCSDFFNSSNQYRRLTEMLLSKINGCYIELVNTNIEFAGSAEEVDLEIKKFIDKVRNEINNYKHLLIKLSFQPVGEEGIVPEELQEVKEKNLINMGLNFIKFKVGDKIYQTAKLGNEAEREDVVLDDINGMIIYIYVIKGFIEDKKQKQEEFVDFVATNYDVKDERYLYIMKKQFEFINEKDYSSFVDKYNEITEEVVAMTIERDQNIEFETKKNIVK